MVRKMKENTQEKSLRLDKNNQTYMDRKRGNLK